MEGGERETLQRGRDRSQKSGLGREYHSWVGKRAVGGWGGSI